MTIKELCENTKCCNCIFYSICIRDKQNPQQWDDYMDRIITRAIIETARKLEEDNNDD